MDIEYQFEVWQDDACQVIGSAETMEELIREANHYAMMYSQDGPVEIRYFERRNVGQNLAAFIIAGIL